MVDRRGLHDGVVSPGSLLELGSPVQGVGLGVVVPRGSCIIS